MYSSPSSFSTLQLADFGFSKEIRPNEILFKHCGSPLYASPEMILGRPYFGPECDVWSLGVALYAMLTATMPFDDRNFVTFMKKLEKGEYPEPAGVSESKRINLLLCVCRCVGVCECVSICMCV